MRSKNNSEVVALEEYIQNIDDQELKGILLKLKNEVKKPDITWRVIKTILVALKNKNEAALLQVLPIILR